MSQGTFLSYYVLIYGYYSYHVMVYGVDGAVLDGGGGNLTLMHRSQKLWGGCEA